jgi:YbgC/YbaW family acyl-CoA thioester hydrolase
LISEFRHKRRVNFYETDQAGIVHFSNFYRYMEEAEHQMWREGGMSVAERDATVGWPRVQASFEYFRPLRYDEEFEILIRVVEIAERRIRYSCLLSSGGAKVAVGSMTIACVRKLPNEPMRSIPIPPEIVSRFQVAP